MNYDELQEILEATGFSPYQAELYTALFVLGDAPITDVLSACTVPQPRIYDVVRDLENKGYVETYEQEKVRARINDPHELIEELRKDAEAFENAADKLESEWRNPKFGKHQASVFNKFDALVSEAKSGIAAADSHVHLAVSVDAFFDLRTALATAKDNGAIVQISLYTESETLLSSTNLDTEFEATATEVCNRQSPAPFVAIVDGNTAYVGIQDQPADEYGVLIKDRILTSMMYWYFQLLLWQHWDVVYMDSDGKNVDRYVNIRECIQEISPQLENGESVRARVKGYNTKTGDYLELEGIITDTIHRMVDSAENIGDSLSMLKAAIVLDVDGEQYTVGGYGAIVEDIRATQIILENRN